MRMLSFLSFASLAGAAVAMAAGHLGTAAAEETQRNAAAAGAATRISGPFTHDNLTVYFVHGPSAAGPVPLTLAEALEKGAVKVLETGNVNRLEIENTGDDDVFIQTGDIVKGGKQDRVLTTSLVVPPRSGRVPIDSYCVEQGRWAPRGTESVAAFAVSREALPSREAKLAINKPAVSAAAPTAERTVRVPSYTDRLPNALPEQRLAGRSDTGSRQGEVWQEVAKTQMKLAAGLGAASVAAPESKSSLQLTLEHEKLKAARAAYLAALRDKTAGQGDVVGLVFAVNGKLNSADVYPSNGLFVKMWPKLLNASVTEAIGERPAVVGSGSGAAPPAPAGASIPRPADVAAFLAAAEQGQREAKPVGKLMQREVRDTAAALYVEARRASGDFVHRNYLAK